MFAVELWKKARSEQLEASLTLRFEVKGQSYMLSFDPNEGRWYLLTPGIDGRVKAMPVLNDSDIGLTFAVIPTGDEGQAIVN